MITNKKFTKGEWINLGYRVDVDIADGLSGICEMSDWMPEEQMEANAKLIAAAPELLEACEKALDTLENENIFGQVRLLLAVAIKKATE